MKIISHNRTEVKGYEFVPGREDRATQECDPSARPAPSGRDSSPSKRGLGPSLSNAAQPQSHITQTPSHLGGANAINSHEADISYGVAGNNDLDVVGDSFPASVGLSLILANCRAVDSIGIEAIVQKYRIHLSKMEHTPVKILHIFHVENDSEALYRVTACSTSRYFPEGRAALRRCILQRLGVENQPGVFLTLTTDVKRCSLLESWPMIWPNFHRFKKSLNYYRKQNMEATGSVRYIAAIEPCKSSYPHMHVFFPGLRWLIKKPDLARMDKWWKMGCTRTEKERKNDSAGEYVTKYLTKLTSWSEASMALLWHYRMRLYNLSNGFYAPKEESPWLVRHAYRDPRELAREIDISLRSAEDIFDSEESFIWLVKDEG